MTEQENGSGFAAENLLWVVLLGLALWLVFRSVRSTRNDQ
jgi:hypothetical protein